MLAQSENYTNLVFLDFILSLDEKLSDYRSLLAQNIEQVLCSSTASDVIKSKCEEIMRVVDGDNHHWEPMEDVVDPFSI